MARARGALYFVLWGFPLDLNIFAFSANALKKKPFFFKARAYLEIFSKARAYIDTLFQVFMLQTKKEGWLPPCLSFDKKVFGSLLLFLEFGYLCHTTQ